MNKIEYLRKYRIERKEELSQKRKKKYRLYRELILRRNKEWRDKHITKEQQSKYNRQYRKEHLEELREYDANRKLNPKYRVFHRTYEKKYYDANKPKVLARQKKYKRHKRRTDVQYRLASNLRGRLYDALSRYRKGAKVISAVKELGCTIPEFVEHLERHFLPGMSWDNYGKEDGQWSIDHTKPLSSFDLSDPEQAKTACHYSNLAPMWHIDNMHKHDKI